MLGLATGRYTILRGTTTTNEYGDEVQSDDPIATHVLGSVLERTRSNYDPQSSRVVTLRNLTARFKSGTDIRDGDRVVDERTGIVFLVNSVNFPVALVNSPDVVAEVSLN